MFELGGDDRNTPDEATLSSRNFVGPAEIGKMLADEILATANPGAATVDTGQQLAAIGDR
jgi:hypothetical protein